MKIQFYLIIQCFAFLFSCVLFAQDYQYNDKQDLRAYMNSQTGQVLHVVRKDYAPHTILIQRQLFPVEKDSILAGFANYDAPWGYSGHKSLQNDAEALGSVYERNRTYKAVFRGFKFDYNLGVKGEILGYTDSIWRCWVWDDLSGDSMPKTKPTIVLADYYVFYSSPLREDQYRTFIDHGCAFEVTPSQFKRFQAMAKEDMKNRRARPKSQSWEFSSKSPGFPLFERLLKESSQETDTVNLDGLGPPPSLDSPEFNEWSEKRRSLRGEGLFPIICIDPKNHSGRADKNDWEIDCFLNIKNGDFYQYFSATKLWDYPAPLDNRHIALDYLAGVNRCRKSTVAVILDAKEKVTKIYAESGFINPHIITSYEGNLVWQPDPPPEDKNLIPKNRLYFYEKFNAIYGSWCPIWELGIWKRLGIQLRRNPEAEVYLVGYGTLLQAAETKTVEEEHALIKRCGVQITPAMYQMFERMSKSPINTPER